MFLKNLKSLMSQKNHKNGWPWSCGWEGVRDGIPLPSFIKARVISAWLLKSVAIPLYLLIILSVLIGCATVVDQGPQLAEGESAEESVKEGPSESPPIPSKPKAAPPSIARKDQALFSLEERMSVTNVLESSATVEAPEATYSFRAQDLPLPDAIALFSRVNELNIVVGPEVEGAVTVDFKGLSLERAMMALLDAHGYYWDKKGDLIIVRRLETRTFVLDYIRLERSGTGRNKANVSSGGQDAGEVTLSQKDEIKFWEEIEGQIQNLLSEEGRLVVNRLSGTIQVTDLHRRVEEVATFLASVRRSLYRQVEIQARIYEVTLRDDYSLGINWDKIALQGGKGSLQLANIIASPIGGIIAKATTTTLSWDEGDFEGVLQALSEQGEVKVISQPRLLTLNNQPALIKVGTDQSFFTSTVTQGTGGTGNIVTEQVTTITSGLVLAVTPQISEDGWIMLDVSPIITRLTDTITSANGSTAPVLDVKQTGSLVRLRDGEMVVIGGLIQEQMSETERKVPILGDIPFLGRLFRGTYQAKTISELVIFITPRIVKAGS